LKIIVLTKNYGAGYTGATSATYELIKEWTLKHVDVEIVTTNIVGKTNSNVKIYHCSNKREMIRHLKNVAKSDQCVGYSDDHLGFFFHIAGIKYIHTYHGNWPNAMFINGLKGIIQGIWFIPQYVVTIHSSKIVCDVSAAMSTFTKRFNSNEQIIRNGTGTLKYREVREPIFLKTNRLRILMVGGVDSRKYAKLLEILSSIDSSTLKKIRIDIYGDVHDARVLKKMLNYSNINMKGFASTIPYEKYDLLLSTSKVENLSIASIEALSSGIPVIGFKVGGMPEVIKRNKNGLLAKRFDSMQIASWLKQMVTVGMRIDFDNLPVINEFNWRMASKKYLELFKVVIK